MSNPYDALRKVVEHEANQDDDGGFFARLGGIQPEHDDEGPTAKGLFQKINKDAWEKANPPIWPSTGGIIPRAKTQLRKRQPIVKVRAEHISNSYGQLTRWKWECEICPFRNWHATYPAAIAQATHHARNHHRSKS